MPPKPSALMPSSRRTAAGFSPSTVHAGEPLTAAAPHSKARPSEHLIITVSFRVVAPPRAGLGYFASHGEVPWRRARLQKNAIGTKDAWPEPGPGVWQRPPVRLFLRQQLAN